MSITDIICFCEDFYFRKIKIRKDTLPKIASTEQAVGIWLVSHNALTVRDYFSVILLQCGK